MDQSKQIKLKPMLLVSSLFLGSISVGSLTSNKPVIQASTISEEPADNQLFIQDTIELEYGDDMAVNTIIQNVHDMGVVQVSEKNKVSSNTANDVYLVDNLQISISGQDIHKVGSGDIKVSIQEAKNADLSINDLKFISITNKKSIDEPTKGLNYTYNLHIDVQDNEAPIIELKEDYIEVDEGGNFHPEDYVNHIYDEVDGDILDYDVEDGVDTSTPGEYTVSYRARDVSGNEAEATLQVVVNERIIPTSFQPTNTISDYALGNSVVAAAYNQLGMNQDCTRLVSNALQAVGISHHSSPAGYMVLGNVISSLDAQPGDLIYYADGGAGIPHVAVYIGNGMAIHGGWKGYTTVIASAYVGNNPIFIRLR